MTTLSPAPGRSAAASVAPGLLMAGGGVAFALAAHGLVPQIGVLTWAVGAGAALSNLGLVPQQTRSGLALATRRLLRAGVALLGFALPLGLVTGLGLPVIALVVTSVFCTLFLTTWLGVRLGLPRPTALLVGTGFAICGAAAVAAMQRNADAEDDDVAVAIAMVTLFGTVAMVALPLLQVPLGLDATEYGVWAGASVHEVGQVVAAAGPAGATAVGVAVVVKLTRVLLLAPVVAGAGLLRRGDGTARPPLVPMFVLAFLACVLLRSTGAVPDGLLVVLEHLQTTLLAAALFGLGTTVHLASLVRRSGRVLLLASVSTGVVAAVSLTGVLVLV